ncbi:MULTISPECIES: EamA family transporter RarD [unclassified Pseudonocardia]|uniref:EamA family transporter RarD n=1 Tax=unclassified Pseudonocardia TaxID=2619320 RepID=UPI0025D96391|nr:MULTISPECIES: EamA family transporter RarD [unclassified Pseudonocardia]
MSATDSAGTEAVDRTGLAAAAAANTLWGLLPAFWAMMTPAGPLEILAQRILWTSLIMFGVLAAVRGWSQLRGLRPRTWLAIATGAVLITVNWGGFIVLVQLGHVLEAALGYFVSPLVSVLLGVVVLRERLRPAQWVAVGMAAVAVAIVAVDNGRVPWIGLTIAVSFGLYGLIKKTVPVDATAGLTAEGVVLGPVALATAVVIMASGHGTFGHGAGHTSLMVASGLVTVVPMLLYGIGARRVPLTVTGLLMYVNPVLQFLYAVVVAREDMPASRWIGFALVWSALAVFSVDMLRDDHRRRAAARAAEPVATST